MAKFKMTVRDKKVLARLVKIWKELEDLGEVGGPMAECKRGASEMVHAAEILVGAAIDQMEMTG